MTDKKEPTTIRLLRYSLSTKLAAMAVIKGIMEVIIPACEAVVSCSALASKMK